MVAEFMSESHPNSMTDRRRRILWSVIVSILLVVVAVALLRGSSAERRWAEIARAVERREFERAIVLCGELAEAEPDEAAEALGFASEISVDRLAQFQRAEEFAQRALAIDVSNRRALRSYIRLLTMTGRRWQSIPWLARFVTWFDQSTAELIWLADTSVVITDWELLQRGQAQVPNDPLPILGLAKDRMVDHPEQAVVLLQECLRLQPELTAAQACLGNALLDAGDESGFVRWDRSLPESCEKHPAVWSARGRWWQARDSPAALRCYLECCRLSPEDAEAVFQVSLLLQQVGELEAASVFRERFGQINEYLDLVRRVRERNDFSVVLQAAEAARRLQRPAEALGWYRLAVQQGLASPSDLEQRMPPAAKIDAVIASRFNPDDFVDRTRWPLPGASRASGDTSDPRVTEFGVPHFEEITDSVGMRFQYDNGVAPRASIEFLHQANGGGVAAIDFDADGWPDLFFTQGGRSPDQPQLNTGVSDALFRNLDGVRADDVSAAAGVTDRDFGQGCTVGDFDNNGFADLVVAGTRANRLLRNCGDGTFDDVTLQAGLSDSAWTSSCALADLNGDTAPDLYEVRYVAAKDVFDRRCFASDGVPRGCAPNEFAPAGDVLWLGTGDGRFEKSSPESLPADRGRGLGLVVADFDQRPGSGLEIFVGNDGTADFLLANKASSRGHAVQLRDEAVYRGVATNGSGSMQATMGIAFGDVNRDGLPDLFQANFYGEPGTLYLNTGGGLWRDGTWEAGLHASSLSLLGWGTEFLDADLDGWLDLVAVNGHLEDLTRQGIPFQMPAKCFRNDGRGRFSEVSPKDSGEWFRRLRLSRSLATLDWNRDGQLDFAVSNLTDPAALLAGQTAPVGRYVTLHLRAISSARDAIGTVVTIEVGGLQLVHQLSCGDGFHASNQRMIHIGLGAETQADRVTVRWPGGRIDEWPSLQANAEYIVVEGQPPRLTR